MKIRYSNFAHRINVEAFEEAIGFEPINTLGDNDTGYCPLPWGHHKNGDTTGKFAIHREKMVYNCWVCGGGSLLSLAMAMKNLDVEGATEWLYQFTTSEKDTDLADRVRAIFDTEYNKAFAMPYYNSQVLEKWESPDHPWFTKRGISKEVAHRHRLGHSFSMKKYAPIRGGVPIEEPYVGEAIIFPHFWDSQLVGWQNRWLTDDRPKWVSKYTNTPDFPRNETLFNYDNCSLRDELPIIVESVPTALFLESQGYSALATFGAAVTDSQLLYLRGFQQGVMIAPDNDGPGEKYVGRIGDYLERFVSVKVILPPEGAGADLGDLVSDTKRLSKLVEEANGL